MFTAEHFIWMAICVAFIGALSFLSYRFKFSFRTAAFVMAGISLASEMSKILSHMNYVNGTDPSEGMVIGADSLPFHLCSLFIFVFFYLPFAKNERLKKYLLGLTVPVGMIGSLLAILMATSGTDFTAAEPYQCFLYHSGMIWFAAYLIGTKQAELGKRTWIINMISLFAMSVLMIWVNGLLQVYDTNFLYVVRPPVEGLPILTLDNGWYAYYGTLLLCGFVGLTLMHLPFMIMERKKR